jgi:hypothetical protein
MVFLLKNEAVPVVPASNNKRRLRVAFYLRNSVERMGSKPICADQREEKRYARQQIGRSEGWL